VGLLILSLVLTLVLSWYDLPQWLRGGGNIDPNFLHGISGGDYYFSDNVI
jgi:hypothetical protein